MSKSNSSNQRYYNNSSNGVEITRNTNYQPKTYKNEVHNEDYDNYKVT